MCFKKSAWVGLNKINVEFHSKNKFEKSVHLVGFIIRNLARCTVTWRSNYTMSYTKDLHLHNCLGFPDHCYEIKALLHRTKANDTFSMLRLHWTSSYVAGTVPQLYFNCTSTRNLSFKIQAVRQQTPKQREKHSQKEGCVMFGI